MRRPHWVDFIRGLEIRMRKKIFVMMQKSIALLDYNVEKNLVLMESPPIFI
jgi:hypothetical protein